MALDQPFTTTSPAIASFSFSEFASGLGFVKFFLAATTDGAGEDFILTEQVVRADPTSKVLPFDLDFDLATFADPITVEGDATISLTTNWVSAGGTNNYTYTIIIRKWDGTTETDLVTLAGEDRTVATSTSGTNYD